MSEREREREREREADRQTDRDRERKGWGGGGGGEGIHRRRRQAEWQSAYGNASERRQTRIVITVSNNRNVCLSREGAGGSQ